MKKQPLYLLIVFSVSLFASACKEYYVTESPKASFKVLKSLGGSNYEETATFKVGETVFIQNTGTGETFTVYTGDLGRDGFSDTYIDKGIEKVNTGSRVEHPRQNAMFKYTYNTAGTYTIRMFAISYDNERSAKTHDSFQEITIVK